MPVVAGGFLFAFASKCIPTFFSVFLAEKGYSTIDVILISTIFFIGSLCVSHDFIKNKTSNKVFQISAAVGSIILHIQAHIHFVIGWFIIRFIQGAIDILCRNSLNNLVPERYIGSLNFFMNIGSSLGFLLMCFPELFNFILTITGVVLQLSLIVMALQKDHIEYSKVIDIKRHKAFTSWYSILRNNSTLFIAMLVSTFLTATFNTILPITLRYNYFVNSSILRIMFVGSLGNAIIQMTGSYMRNMFGTRNFLKITLMVLPFLYLGLLFCMYYQLMFIVIFVFFISGFHSVINSTVASIFREKEEVSYRLSRHGINQINHIGSIISSVIALVFITILNRYGLLIFWLLSISAIWLIVRSLNMSKTNHTSLTHGEE